CSMFAAGYPQTISRERLMTLTLAAASLIAGFGSSFQYGYNVAVINSPAPEMKLFYTRIYEDRYGPMSDNLLTLLWSVTVSMYPLGGFFGSLMVAPLVNKFGRSFPLNCIGFRIFHLSVWISLSSNVVSMYLGEIAPKNYRGAIGIVPQLFITIGILVAQVFGVRNILGNMEGWPIMLGLTGIPAAIELLLLPFFPESPRYMLIQKGDEKTARKGLQRLRGWEDVDEELCEMRVEEQSEQAEGRLSVLNLFTFRSLRWQLLSVIFMNMGQQLSGVNAIYYYADSIYSSAGVAEDHVQYVTVGTGAVNVFMTIAAVFIVEKSGRKLLLLIGFGVCCGACVLLTIALYFQLFLHPSAGPIPNVITTEMFRQSSRPPAFMVAGTVHWLSNFTVGLVFPFLERGLGAYSFIIFACICLATLIYIGVVIPETKNKTFLETSKLFAHRNRVDIVVEAGDSEIKETGGESNEQEIKNTFL
uniref:Solute carrier family 2, facilitated glucose transporter member 5 n=1 Tax=Sinocyclocheilus anshuiensis TaxID=1608454 RepID=A0A671PHF0_9TELE